jgi:hypothetical protein
MQYLEGSGTPVLYIGRTFLKVKNQLMHNQNYTILKTQSSKTLEMFVSRVTLHVSVTKR